MSSEDRISSPLIPDLEDVTVTTGIHGVGMTDFRDPPPLMASSSGAGTERGPSTYKGKERETSPDQGEKRGTVNKDDVFEPGGRDRHGVPPRYIPPALQLNPEPSRDLLCRTPKCPSGRASPSQRQGLPASPPARARIAAKPSCQRKLAARLASPATPVTAPPKILPQTPRSRQTIRSNRRNSSPDRIKGRRSGKRGKSRAYEGDYKLTMRGSREAPNFNGTGFREFLEDIEMLRQSKWVPSHAMMRKLGPYLEPKYRRIYTAAFKRARPSRF